MDFVELNVSKREENGKGASRQLRRLGFVPAVIYGGQKGGAVALQLKAQELSKIVNDGNRNAILKLKGLDGETNAIIKELQKEPAKERYLHVDLQRVAMDTEIDTVVTVELVGDSIGLREGGVLQHNLREIHIKALPKNIPEKFEVDITELAIGSSIKVSDLTEIDGVQITSNPDENVVGVVPPTELKEEEIAPAGEEGAEEGEQAAEAEGAEGAKEEKEAAEE